MILWKLSDLSNSMMDLPLGSILNLMSTYDLGF